MPSPATAQNRSLLTTLVLFAMLGPFAMTSFVPALPAIQASFDTTSAVTQLVLTLSLVGTALASLGYGKLSDSVGWRSAILISLSLAIAGSVIAALGSQIETVVAGRLLQAVGAGSGFVLIRVIVRDVFDGARATMMMGYFGAAMAVAPMIAPLLGGLVLDHAHWRWVFGAVAIGSTLLLLLSLVTMPPGLNLNSRRAGRSHNMGLGNWQLLFQRPDYLRFAIVNIAVLATFYAFVSGAPYLLIGTNGNGLSATQYGLYYSLVPAGFLSGSLLAGRFGARLGNDRLTAMGCVLNLTGSALTLILTSLFGASALAIVAPFSLAAVGAGLAITGAQTGLVESSPDQPGVASGVTACLQLLVSAVVVQLTGVFVDQGAMVVTMTMVLASSSGLIGYAWWSRKTHALNGALAGHPN